MEPTGVAQTRREIRSKRVRVSRVAISRLSCPVVVRGRVADRRAPAFAKSIRARLAQTCAGRINRTRVMQQSNSLFGPAQPQPIQFGGAARSWRTGPGTPVIWPNEVHVW